MICSVCGGREFADHRVLPDRLTDDWQLSPYERHYTDRQQGTRCAACGANLRSIALANAIRFAVGCSDLLHAFVDTSGARRLALLEINEAGTLSPILRRLPGHVFAQYPDVDIHAMPYAAESFDLIVHSDTLEHVVNPLHALAECRRVLRTGGVMCFTVPTIVGRLSRSRDGLPKSYHAGAALANADDVVVQTEFGADVWTYVLEAGFSAVTINSVDYPSALAVTARK